MPPRALGLGAGFLGPIGSPLPLLGTGLLGPAGGSDTNEARAAGGTPEPAPVGWEPLAGAPGI
jgi:hypothetical protein